MSRLKHFALVLLVSACGNDDEPCSPSAQTGCDDGMVCENVSGGQPACFAPIAIEGRVFDLANQMGVASARVVAVDVNGAAVSNVVTSATDGKYKLPIPTDRNADGTPVSLGTVTLRADAQGYDAFPGTVRQPLPIDMTAAVADGDGLTVKSTLTDVAMLTAADGGAAGRIEGKIELPDGATGAVVVAEANGTGYPAIVARNGEYAILNVPAGAYTVNAYMTGHNYAAATADVAAATVKVDLKLAADAASAVSGLASIVNGSGATTTSVVLFIESTYDPMTGRGVTVPGLRAADVSTAFSVDGVPAGKYVVVAAFENDGLVRDPDLCISGTDDVHIDVAAATPLSISQTFKITGAVAVTDPGATSAQAVTGTPTFKWVDDSGEASYLVELYDAYGQRVWMKTMAGVSGGTPTMAYDGDALTSGMYYQFRVTSLSNNNCALSRTEDLKGVFYMN